MQSRYDSEEAARTVDRYAPHHSEELALRVYTSRLLGQDSALVLHGGGNTSLKTTAREITGDTVEVLSVKGSGWDLASIEPSGFPACRLSALRRIAALPDLGDEDLVRALRGQLLDPLGPTPSVEALLHALVPARFVDHTHADAVLALVDQPDGAARAHDVWGDGLVFVPYAMPGVALARRVAGFVPGLEKARVMVLDKHGIFTWGETARESYERMIDAVTAAERALPRTTVAVPRSDGDAQRKQRQRELGPAIRGAFARAADGQHFIFEWRDEPAILELLSREDAPQVTRLGTATPDHVIRTKPLPLWLDEPAESHAVTGALEDYARWYETYVARAATARGRDVARLDRLPRVVLVPGVGALAAGETLADARIAGDIYAHTAVVILGALSMGGYKPLDELDLFDVEYWSPEQAKLDLGRRAAGPLARRIALITGAASGIGLATARLFVENGAHVLLADRDEAALEAAKAALAPKHGAAIATAAGDVTRPADVAAMVDRTVDAFGGLDLVVSNAGTAPVGLLHQAEGEAALLRSIEINLLSHQYVAHAATTVMLAQGAGGCLLFNASKSAFNQGPEFGPYAIAKAGVVALMKQYAVDLGKHGIRTGAINADRIRTGLFGGGVLEARAKARGVEPDEYFRQNLLHRETTGDDVAGAFLYLATAGATTGAVLTVDGGNPAAFPR